MLRAHAHTIYQVEVGERDHCQLIIVHHERKPVAVSIDVDLVADASNRRYQFVPLYFAFEKSLRIQDVETGGFVPKFGFFFRAIVLREVVQLIRFHLAVRYGVQVALMQVVLLQIVLMKTMLRQIAPIQ